MSSGSTAFAGMAVLSSTSCQDSNPFVFGISKVVYSFVVAYTGVVRNMPLGGPAMTDKVTTVRFPTEQANALETVARVDDVAVSEIIRSAVDAHIERRRQDPEFMARLKARIDQDQRLLTKLGKN